MSSAPRSSDDQVKTFMDKVRFVRQADGAQALASAVSDAEQSLGEDVRRLHYLSVPPRAAVALAESFVDSDKTELIADRVWRSRTQLELAAVEYVSWFNHDPLHESLGPDRVRSPKRPDIARPVSGGDLSEGRRRAENASRLDARRRFPRQQPDLSRQRSRCSRSGFAQAAPTAGQGTKGGPWPLRSTVQSHTG